MAQDPKKWAEDVLRVTVHDTDVSGLMTRYPKLTRTEIIDVVARVGPMSSNVERELTRLSSLKR
jgi:hypothetical protein